VRVYVCAFLLITDQVNPNLLDRNFLDLLLRVDLALRDLSERVIIDAEKCGE
jgi:hypothetical protein